MWQLPFGFQPIQSRVYPTSAQREKPQTYNPLCLYRSSSGGRTSVDAILINGVQARRHILCVQQLQPHMAGVQIAARVAACMQMHEPTRDVQSSEMTRCTATPPRGVASPPACMRPASVPPRHSSCSKSHSALNHRGRIDLSPEVCSTEELQACCHSSASGRCIVPEGKGSKSPGRELRLGTYIASIVFTWVT